MQCGRKSQEEFTVAQPDQPPVLASMRGQRSGLPKTKGFCQTFGTSAEWSASDSEPTVTADCSQTALLFHGDSEKASADSIYKAASRPKKAQRR